MLFSVLSSEFFQHQLEFTNEQTKDIANYLDETRQSSVLSGKFRAARFATLLEGNADYPKTLAEILIPEQVVFLRQAELQFYSGAARTSFGLLHKKVALSLDLTATQIDKIKSVVTDFEPKLQGVLREVHEKLTVVGVEYARERIKLITPVDKKRFKLLTGEDSDDLDAVFENVLKKRVEEKKTFKFEGYRIGNDDLASAGA